MNAVKRRDRNGPIMTIGPMPVSALRWPVFLPNLLSRIPNPGPE